MHTTVWKPFLITLLFLSAMGALRVQAKVARAPFAFGGIIYVDTLDDVVSEDGFCSLREAVLASNRNAVVDSCTPGSATETDRILLPAGYYQLSLIGEDGAEPAILGDLDILADLVLEGAGEENTTIDGGDIDRVFHIVPGINVLFQRLTIQNGTRVNLGGGCIWNSGTVTFQEVTIRACNTGGSGGGLLNWASPALVISSAGSALSSSTFLESLPGMEALSARELMSQNRTAQLDSPLLITPRATFIDSFLTGNVAGDGGAVFNGSYSEVYLYDSTLSANIASDTINGYGGALDNAGLGQVSNVTISGNNAVLGGGGVFNDGTLEIDSSTIVNNSSSEINTGGNVQSSYLTRFSNTLVANSLSDLNCVGDADDLVSLGYNLDSGDTCQFSQPTDVSDTGELNIGSLENNGGFTLTHALPLGSPAIDVGDDGHCPSHDQRGAVRPADGDGDDVLHCDIGAYEFNGEFPEIIFLPMINQPLLIQ